MPVFVPVVRTGNILTPQFVPPGAVGVAVASNNYVFDTGEDFFLPDIPARLGTNVLATARVVERRFAGMHYHVDVPTVAHSIARNVDLPGCMWWSVARAGRGVYDWSALDAFVATAAAAGREIVFNLMGTPTWASARPGEEGHYTPGSDAEPANIDDLGAFVSEVATRYRARGTPITAFETWNEPKYAGGGSVAQGNYFTGTPEVLARMARAVYRAAKAADPTVLILSPAPTGLEFPWVTGDGSGTDHLQRFCAADDGAGGAGRDWLDIVAFHSYSHDGYNNVFSIPQMVANVRTVIALHGLADRPIWITETSAITPPLASFVVRRQQEYIARTLLLALGSGVARVVWYAWDDRLGFHQQPAVAAHWNELTAQLAGATISLVNLLRDGRVAAIVDGRRLLF